MTAAAAEPFADAVAQLAGMTPADVADILARHGVVAAPQPPIARQLKILRIAFSGEKRHEDGSTQPFNFTWDVAQPGLWGIASDENSVGKSTVLQVALWALRGTPKRVTKTVLSWIQHVDVWFQAATTRVDVMFALEDGNPRGKIRLSGPAGATEQAFGTEDQFKRAMQDVMLEALALEPIPASRTSGDGRILAYDDGWAAYTGAFLTDADSNAIIGETIPNTDITSRLLQVFLGLPWATTLFQARARRRLLASEAEQRRRKLSALGGKSIEQVEAELADVQSKIVDEGARNQAAQEFLDAQHDYDELAAAVRASRRESDEAKGSAEEAKAAEIRAQRLVNTLREEQAAAVFLRRLSPVCCPRCERPISPERRKRELSERRCSVCNEEVQQADSAQNAAALAEALARAEETRKMASDAARAARDLEQRYERRRAELAEAGFRLQAKSTAGTAADVQVLGRRKERLEGMLDVARVIMQAEGADDAALKVLDAAEREAGNRLSAAADDILRRASDEVCRIATQLGMRDVSRIDLKRNANVRIHQGGGISNFSDLSPGEQLRLRVATVAALVRSARDRGAGRHPGLLLIDSPGNEEMTQTNVAGMLEGLAKLADEIPDLQIFVAMQGVERAEAAIPSDRLLVARSGEFIW